MSSEYGWTSDEIFSLTMKEVDWRVKNIIDRKNLDATFEAKIHGVEIKAPKTSSDANDEEMKVTPEQQQAMDEAIEAAIARNSKRYGR